MLANARTSCQNRTLHPPPRSLTLAGAKGRECFLHKVTFASLNALKNQGSVVAFNFQRLRDGSECVLLWFLLCPVLQNQRQKIRSPCPTKSHNGHSESPPSGKLFPPKANCSCSSQFAFYGQNPIFQNARYATLSGGRSSDRFFCHSFCSARNGASGFVLSSARSSHDEKKKTCLQAVSKRLVPRTFSVACKRNPARAYKFLRCLVVGGRYRLPPPARSFQVQTSTQ